MERIEYIDHRHHVLVPLDHKDVISPRTDGHVYSQVAMRLDRDNESMDAFLKGIAPFMDSSFVESIKLEKENDTLPYWNNGYFNGDDARSLIAILQTHNPDTYLEIGSGNSTKFARHTIGTMKLKTKIVSIDPEPRAEIDALCDSVIRKSVLDCGPDVFRSLRSGDILFWDGSHIVLNGSDTVHFWLEIFPALAPGVLVHIHDINLPREYTQSFDRRGYAEQYMLATALLQSDRIEVLFPVTHLVSQGKIRHGGASFWLRKKP